jgi:hypothetical protein
VTIRPISVSVIAAFLLAATFIAALVGTSLLFPGTFLHRIWELNKPAYAPFNGPGRISGLLLLLLGVCTAYAGQVCLKASTGAVAGDCSIRGEWAQRRCEFAEPCGSVQERGWCLDGSNVSLRRFATEWSGIL